MHTINVRRGATVALALILALTLALEKPARAQSGATEFVRNSAGWTSRWISTAPTTVDTSQLRELLVQAQRVGGPLMVSARNVREAVAAGNRVWQIGGGAAVVVPGLTAVKSSIAVPSAKLAGAGVVGIGAGTAAAAAATGVAVGWGIVHSGLWDWADCQLTGESPSCDPVPPTIASGWAPVRNPDARVYGHWPDHEYAGDVVGGGPMEGDPTRTVIEGTNPTGGSYRVYIRNSAGSVQSFSRSGATYTVEVAQPVENITVVGIQAAAGHVDYVHEHLEHYGLVEGDGGAVADRQIVTTATCLDPSTGTTSVVSESSGLYAPGDEQASPAVVCPDGFPVVASATVTREVDGQPEASTALAEYTAPEALTNPDPSDPLVAAGCYEGGCDLTLHKGGTASDPNCEDDDVVCLGWWDQMVAGNGNYTCAWGGVVVPWTDCEPLRNVDGEPDSTPGDGLDGNPTTDPNAGVGTSGNPAHVEDGCDAGGGSWLNPFDNIAGGVACAMEWAFVPSDASLTELDAATDAMAETVPFTYVSQISTWAGSFSDLDSATGCLNITVPVNTGRVDYGDQQAFDCNGPVGTQMRTGTVRTVLTAIVWGFFVLPLGWWAWRQYAPGSQGEA